MHTAHSKNVHFKSTLRLLHFVPSTRASTRQEITLTVFQDTQTCEFAFMRGD